MSLIASIDWYQVSFINIEIETLIDKILRLPSKYFSEYESRLFGYEKEYTLGDIKILGRETDNGFESLIYLTGSPCRQMEKFLVAQKRTWSELTEKCLDHNGKFSRLDIALDDKKTYFNLNKILQKARKGEIVSRFKTCRFMEGITLSDGESLGKTIYFGSAQSRQMFRFYEKNYEQAKNQVDVVPADLEPWNRYEIQTRHESSMNLAWELVQTEQIQYIMLSLLNQYIRVTNKNENCSQKSKWPTWRPWQQLINDATKLSISYQPKETTVEEKFHHLKKQWGPSYRTIHEAFKEAGVNIDVNQTMLSSSLKEKDLKIKQQYVETTREKRDKAMKKYGIELAL